MSSRTPLRIGVDARELLGESTGVGRYLGELLRRWMARPDAADRILTLYSPESLPSLDTFDARGRFELVIAGTGRGTWWEQTHLRRAVRSAPPDVFFAGAYTAPLALGVPLAVTIHDVSFAAQPSWFRPREGARRRLLTRQAAQAASVIFTDSVFSSREIADRLSVPPQRIKVIPPGVTMRSGSPVREPLVLFVGSILNRRRLPTAIAAFADATRDMPEARFVIAGPDRSYPALDLPGLAAEAGVGARVEIKSYVSDADLDVLYSRAALFVFLSEYEGFGLTPLEALSAGVPIVVLDTPVAREIYGEAAWYVSPDDAARETSDAIRTLLQEPLKGSAMLQRAGSILSRYSWDRAADETLDAIEAVVR
jgi:glycosyltransferase involved in cell wall biosynthesis